MELLTHLFSFDPWDLSVQLLLTAETHVIETYLMSRVCASVKPLTLTASLVPKS